MMHKDTRLPFTVHVRALLPEEETMIIFDVAAQYPSDYGGDGATLIPKEHKAAKRNISGSSIGKRQEVCVLYELLADDGFRGKDHIHIVLVKGRRHAKTDVAVAGRLKIGGGDTGVFRRFLLMTEGNRRCSDCTDDVDCAGIVGDVVEHDHITGTHLGSSLFSQLLEASSSEPLSQRVQEGTDLGVNTSFFHNRYLL